MTTISHEESYSKGSIISPSGNYEWEGHSDGNEGIVKITIDGKKEKTIRFTKDELEDLFNQSSVKIPLDKRLMIDFMSDDSEYISPFKNIKSQNKKSQNKKIKNSMSKNARSKKNKNNNNKNKNNNKKSRKINRL